MARFGRNSARQRLRRATHQALSVPTFDDPADCTPWVIGGLWPAELETVTPRTATIAEYLKSDLQRIANSANERIRALRHAGFDDDARRAEEARIINAARAFSVLRVESTVRQLRYGSTALGSDYGSLASSPEPQMPIPEPFQAAQLIEFSEDAGRQADSRYDTAPEAAEAAVPERIAEADEPEPDVERLRRLLLFAARQVPGLRWAVGDRADGTTVLVTDLAHGWLPPDVTLPAEVELLPPAKRAGRIGDLLGDVLRSADYQPGDPFAGTNYTETPTSLKGREVPTVDDLGWKLSEATHSRDGLPRIVHTLAKSGAARTGVVDAEVDVLRVHADTARYQLLAQYPEVDTALLSNCLLLAATEAMATGDAVSANYHFAWFEALDAPSAREWSGQT